MKQMNRCIYQTSGSEGGHLSNSLAWVLFTCFLLGLCAFTFSTFSPAIASASSPTYLNGPVAFVKQTPHGSEIWEVIAPKLPGKQSTQTPLVTIAMLKKAGVDAADITDPAWSPTGNELAFSVRYKSGVSSIHNSDIWTIERGDTTGSTLRRITGGRSPGGQGGNFDPTWSPNGEDVAYASTRQGFYLTFFEPTRGTAAAQSGRKLPLPEKRSAPLARIFVSNIDTGNARMLAPPLRATPRLGGISQVSPTWQPSQNKINPSNDTLILFTETTYTPDQQPKPISFTSKSEVREVAANGEHLAKLWSNTSQASWGSDGDKFTFVYGFGDDSEIFLLDETAKQHVLFGIPGLRRLTENSVKEQNPQLSPDGEYIVFDRIVNDHPTLFVMTTAGGDTVAHPAIPLLSSGEVGSSPSWEPVAATTVPAPPPRVPPPPPPRHLDLGHHPALPIDPPAQPGVSAPTGPIPPAIPPVVVPPPFTGKQKPKIMIKVKPLRVRKLPRKLTVSGTVKLSANVPLKPGCAGRIAIVVRVAKKLITKRFIGVRVSNKSCIFSLQVRVRRVVRRGPLRVLANFPGNELVGPALSPVKTVMR